MLRPCATLTAALIAALAAAANGHAQTPGDGEGLSGLRDSFSETLPPVRSSVGDPARFSPRGGLDRAADAVSAPSPAPASRRAPARTSPPAPEETASIEGSHGPVGIGVGGFDIFPSVEMRGGFQEVSGEEGAYGSLLGNLEARGAIGLVDLDFGLSAEIERDEDDFSDIEADASLAGQMEINRHLGIAGDLGYASNPADGFSFNDENALSNLPDEQVLTAGTSVRLVGNRAALEPRLRAERHFFSGAPGADDLDYTGLETGLRASYEFSPMLSIIGDVEGRQSRFDRTTGGDGVRRGSEVIAAGAGVRYTPGDWLSAEVLAGAEEADFKDGSSLSGARVEGSIAYKPSALTDFTLSARHGLADDIVSSGGVRESRVSLEMVHRFRSYLELSTGVAYLREERQAGGDAARLDLSGQLAYALRRGIYLTAGGEMSQQVEGVSTDETDWQVYMGLKLAR